MKSVRWRLACLLLALLSWGSAAAAQPDIVQIPFLVEMVSYAVAPDGATAAVYPNPMIVREEPPDGSAFVQIIDLASGAATLELTDLPDWVSDAAYLPDGRLLTAHLNGDYILWDVNSGDVERRWWTGLYQSSLLFSPDGSRAYLLGAGTVSTFFEMDMATGAILRAMGRRPATLYDLLVSQADIALRGEYSFVSFALSPDSETLAYADADGALAALDLASQDELLVRPPSEQPMAFNVRSLQFAPDSQSLFYLQYDRDARQVMHVTLDGTPIASYGDQVVAYAVSTDASRVAWVERRDDGATLYMQTVDGGEVVALLSLDELGYRILPLATLNFVLGDTHLVLDVVGDGDNGESAVLLVTPLR